MSPASTQRVVFGPWRTGWRQLRRSPKAVGSIIVLALVLVLCAAAPLYARWVAGSDPFAANPVGTVVLDGHPVPLLQPAERGLGVLPIGPTWGPRFLLGADNNGRDVAARVLFGGRNTLLIGFGAALLAGLVGVLVGLTAGYFRGLLDRALSGLLDILWAFPVLLLAISLSAITFHAELDLGLFRIGSGSLLLPVLIIGTVYVPYVARPIRGLVLSLRESEFVEAAVAYGAGTFRVMVREILPNVLSRIIVLFPLMVATAMLLESGLSFLGIGVRSPDASWGTIIQDGTRLLRNRPAIAIVPGAMIAIVVCALNLLADAVRDAFDPHADPHLVSRRPR